MIELAQHIEILLLENDCVIIPEVGGFVTHYTSATRVPNENTFLPPTRAIGFNPQLKMNDGLLVQSYMAAYGTNFSDATKIVEQAVKELFSRLHEDGKADLANVGELRYSIYNTYSFIPYDNKIATPYLYGLDSFEMQELSALSAVKEKTIPAAVPSVARKQKRRFKLKPNYAYLSNAAAMIAAIVLFFYLSAPIENTEVMEENYAYLLPEKMFEKIEKQSLAMTPVVARQSKNTPIKAKREITPVAVREIKVKQAVSPTPQVEAAAKVATPTKLEANLTDNAPASKKQYHIIVASVASEKEAQTMIGKLLGQGFEKAKILIGDGKTRVSIQSCPTEEEAYKTLNGIRQNEAFQQAWVLKK